MAAEEEKRSDRKVRLILLKSRQIGGTAFSEAIVAHMVFLNPRTQGLIASDHPDNSLTLWRTLIRLYDYLPGWMRPRKDAKAKATNLHLSELDSDVIVGSGNQVTTLGQGMNIDVVHLTEVSTWIYPEYIDADLMPAFESSRKHHSTCVFESTGSGAKGNWFYEQFTAARRGDNLFAPVFIAWYLRPGWKMDAAGIELTPETLEVARRIKRDDGIELSKEQLAWYQVKKRDMSSRGKLDLFYQEFPSSIEEAFQTGLRSVFPITLRSKLREQLREPIFLATVNFQTKKLRDATKEAWKEKPDGKLVVWEWAKPGYIYIVGVDAAYGLEGGDNSSIQVLRVGNKLAPDEQVAEYTSSVSPSDLATVVEIVGKVFADKLSGLPAKLAIEANPGSPGLITQVDLIKRGYPHFYVWRKPTRLEGGWTKEVGWWTTPATRPLLTEGGVDGIEREELLINSPFLIEEMGSFVNMGFEKGKRHLEHAPGYRDDRIMALFIAFYVAHESDMRSIADERRRAQEQLKSPKVDAVQFNQMGKSWDECMAEWEESLLW
jgi:hypothetical protein